MDNPFMQVWALVNGILFAMMVFVIALTFFEVLHGTGCFIGVLFTLVLTSTFAQGIVENTIS